MGFALARAALEQLLHLGPWIGLEALERRPLFLRHAVENRRLDRGTRAHARPPVCDRGMLRPQRLEPEQLEPQDIRNHRAFGRWRSFRLRGKARARAHAPSTTIAS